MIYNSKYYRKLSCVLQIGFTEKKEGDSNGLIINKKILKMETPLIGAQAKQPVDMILNSGNY